MDSEQNAMLKQYVGVISISSLSEQETDEILIYSIPSIHVQGKIAIPIILQILQLKPVLT